MTASGGVKLTCRILLVEDDDEDAELLTWAMRRQPRPFSIHRVPNLATCREAFLHNDYDIILLDLGLPGVSRFEALESLVATAGAPPVMVLTGRDDLYARAQALHAGARAYLVKTTHADEIFAAILQAIDG